MFLEDLLDPMELSAMMQGGYVRRQNHPTIPGLYILNYTEKAQFEGNWNKVTTECRGLICSDFGVVLSRPFPKFFNYNTEGAPALLPDFEVEVTDKMDGSLGISWFYGGEVGIATRGSFASDQAIHATELLHSKYQEFVGTIMSNTDETYLFEIIYPENRIVLNYGDRDELVLLGARNTDTGAIRSPEAVPEWKWGKTTTFSYKTLREALEAPPRTNAEGYVVYIPQINDRVKIKQDDYVALHKIVTGLTPRRIWESMKEGKNLQDLCEIVPDEWHDWLRKTYQVLLDAYWDTYTAISIQFHEVEFHFQSSATRKEFALYVKDMPNAGLLFALLDGKDISEKVWDLVRPAAE